MGETTKQCKFCGEVKIRADFFRHSKNKGGLQAYCKVCSKKSKEKYKWKKDPRKLVEYNKRYRDNNAPKVIAWKLTSFAIRIGFLKKGACAVCGDPNVRGHHEDYLEPLSVVWLCAEHHSARHKEIRDQSNQQQAA